ncbi:MAG: ribonuclease P protein component [Planctomycetes bacterium]|nr:ribonuclease P protein component [Planctomycetota bacterium]
MLKKYGFTKKERLLKRAEFDRVFKNGRIVRDTVLKTHWMPNGLEYSRLGIVISRAVKTAVARNRLKRLCREAFRLNKHVLPKGLDIIIIPKIQNATLDVVSKSLLSHNERMKNAK